MRDWGVLTWIGVLILVLVLLIYYQGAAKLTSAGSSAFGSTVAALTGRTPGLTQAQYAVGG